MFKIIRKHLIFGAVFVLVLIFLSSITPALKSPVLTLLKYPLVLSRLSLRELRGFFFYHRNYVQNEKLEKEISLLRQQLLALNEIYLENKRLHSLFFFKENAPYRVIPARVIAGSIDGWSKAVVIDKGANQGIKRGMVAINHQGLVGRVIESSGSSSKVILLQDANFSVSAISQRSRQEGLVSGTMGNFLVMRYLPKDSDIRLGDMIITSGLSDIFPKGLAVGTVADIGQDFSGLGRYCLIKPAVNFADLEEILVIIP